MKGPNPYTLPAGRELDELIARSFFPEEEPCAFSTDKRWADKVKAEIQALYGHAVVVGQTKLAHKRFFARFESGPSSSTEVLAETLPLAICRLAAVVHSNYNGSR